MASDQTGDEKSLTLREAYLAMHYFVEAYFERGGRKDDGMTMLVTNLRPMDDPQDARFLMTDDPAFWDDWIAAVTKARSEGVP